MKILSNISGAVVTMPVVKGAEVYGGGSVVTTGIKAEFQVPFNCTVTAWRVLSVDGVTGSVAFSLKARSLANYGTAGTAIDGGTGPSMASAATASGSPSFTALAAGDYVSIAIASVSSLTRVRLELTLTPKL